MTSIYLGNDQTEYTLDSGRKIVLSQHELEEISSDIVEDYELDLHNLSEEHDVLETKLDRIQSILNEDE